MPKSDFSYICVTQGWPIGCSRGCFQPAGVRKPERYTHSSRISVTSDIIKSVVDCKSNCEI